MEGGEETHSCLTFHCKSEGFEVGKRTSTLALFLYAPLKFPTCNLFKNHYEESVFLYTKNMNLYAGRSRRRRVEVGG